MAIYYLNGATLSGSTAVFLDSGFVNCAPDGFYSDGSIVREQVGCVLLPPVQCPSCALPCNNQVITGPNQNVGIYYLDVNTFNDIGAIIIRVNTTKVLGILAYLNNYGYANGVSSQFYGWLQSTDPDAATYIGDALTSCLFTFPYSALADEYQYQNGSFINIGNLTGVIDINLGDVNTTSPPPGICTMVIPKTTIISPIVNLTLYLPCANGDFDITIDCPIQLDDWGGSIVKGSSSEACLEGVSQVYYYVHVNGSGGVLGLYDLVYYDSNGEIPLPAGFYNTGSMSASYDWIEVDSHGVVINFGLCPEGQTYLVQRCNDDTYHKITVSGTLTLGSYVILDGYENCIWQVISTDTPPSTATLNSTTLDTCANQCATFSLINSGATDIVNYTDCYGSPQTLSVLGGQTMIVCAREIPSYPPQINVDLSNCVCENYGVYQVESICDPSTTFIGIALISVTLGDIVKISNTGFTDCWFTVVGVGGTPNTNIIFKDNSISYVCCSYLVQNNTFDVEVLSYTNCDGSPVLVTVSPSQTFTICARANSIAPSGLTITFQSCNC